MKNILVVILFLCFYKVNALPPCNATARFKFSGANCPGDTVTFIDSSSASFPIKSREWDFDNDGVYDAEGDTVVYAFLNSGWQKVVLKVTVDTLGCNFIDYDTTDIFIGYPVKISIPDTSICADQKIILATTGIFSNYSWGGDQLAVPVDSSTFLVEDNPGSYIYWVSTTDTNACSPNSDTVNIEITELPLINPNSDTTICSGASVQLDAGSGLGRNYVWSPLAGLSTTGANDPRYVADPKASPVNTTEYKITVTDSLGCINKDSVTITIDTSCNTGISDINNLNKVKILPNPFSDHIDLKIESYQAGYLEYRIYDYTGKLLKTVFVGEQYVGIHQISLTETFKELQKGIYIISVNINGDISNHQILKK